MLVELFSLERASLDITSTHLSTSPLSLPPRPREHHPANKNEQPVQDGGVDHKRPFWWPSPRLALMQAAMALDAPKLTLCGGSGLVGDAMLRDAFRALRAAKAIDQANPHGRTLHPRLVSIGNTTFWHT